MGIWRFTGILSVLGLLVVYLTISASKSQDEAFTAQIWRDVNDIQLEAYRQGHADGDRGRALRIVLKNGWGTKQQWVSFAKGR